MRCLILILILLVTLPMQVYAETTGEAINRIYHTSIAAIDKSALEADLYILETKLEEAKIVSAYNKYEEQARESLQTLIDSKKKDEEAIAKQFDEVASSYEKALETTDLDWVISKRSNLLTFMYEHGINYDSEIGNDKTIYSTKLLMYTGGSEDALQRKIDIVMDKLASVDNSINYGLMPKTYPIEGTFTSGFGVRRDPINGQQAFHSGVDIAAPKGTPIKAWFNGTVEEATNSGGNGNYIAIKQGELSVFYAHLDSIGVQQGDVIEQGQVIGTVGSTGRSTGNHLHLGLYINGIAVDPAKIINDSGGDN